MRSIAAPLRARTTAGEPGHAVVDEAHHALREADDDEHDAEAGQQFEMSGRAELVLADDVQKRPQHRAADATDADPCFR